jgi:hypothetical protein
MTTVTTEAEAILIAKLYSTAYARKEQTPRVRHRAQLWRTVLKELEEL